MKALLVLMVALGFVGCTLANVGVTSVDKSDRVFVYHDDDRGVTCWSNLVNGGIACLPDSAFERR